MRVDDKGYLWISRSELTGSEWPSKSPCDGPSWDDIVGFVTSVYSHADEHTIIFESEGQLWGFEDYLTEDGDQGFRCDFNDASEFQCSPVSTETRTVTVYDVKLPL
jgi:hypothetical protein